MIRGSLTTAVYRKTMEINIKDVGSKTVTLMSTDCERIVRGLLGLHDLWANIVQVALATWLIEKELGIACVGPLAITIGEIISRLS
jgi:ATP-binding cassette subfamily C (CFTR/MRP) protein 1